MSLVLNQKMFLYLKRALLGKSGSDQEFTSDVLNIAKISAVLFYKYLSELKNSMRDKMEIKKLLKQAQDALRHLENGKEYLQALYTAKFLYESIIKIFFLNTMRDGITEKSKFSRVYFSKRNR